MTESNPNGDFESIRNEIDAFRRSAGEILRDSGHAEAAGLVEKLVWPISTAVTHDDIKWAMAEMQKLVQRGIENTTRDPSDHSGSDYRAGVAAHIASGLAADGRFEGYDGGAAGLAEEIRKFLQAGVADDGTSIDSGVGFGGADLRPQVGGVKYNINVRPSSTPHPLNEVIDGLEAQVRSLGGEPYREGGGALLPPSAWPDASTPPPGLGAYFLYGKSPIMPVEIAVGYWVEMVDGSWGWDHARGRDFEVFRWAPVAPTIDALNASERRDDA